MRLLAPAAKTAARRDAPRRVKDWTRERFGLATEDAVLVAELACALPGCPPRETVVAFWSAEGTRHQFKLFKRVDEVVRDDLPYAWLKPALAVAQGREPECC